MPTLRRKALKSTARAVGRSANARALAVFRHPAPFGAGCAIASRMRNEPAADPAKEAAHGDADHARRGEEHAADRRATAAPMSARFEALRASRAGFGLRAPGARVAILRTMPTLTRRRPTPQQSTCACGRPEDPRESTSASPPGRTFLGASAEHTGPTFPAPKGALDDALVRAWSRRGGGHRR